MPIVLFGYVCYLEIHPTKTKSNIMKKLFASVAVLSLSLAVAQAQDAGKKDSNAGQNVQIQRADGARDAVRTDDKQSLRAATPEATRKVSDEQIDRAIADIEQKMKEGEGQENFPREAYEKRLEHLRKLKEQE
jgi:hypothetical protein